MYIKNCYKKIYEKTFFKNKKFDNFLTKRIIKFFEKLIKNKKNSSSIWIWTKKLKMSKIVLFVNGNILINWLIKIKTTFFRLCKHCDNFYWNNNCAKKNSKRIRKTLYEIIDNNNTILNDENHKTYKIFQTIVYRINFDLNFNLNSKNSI